MTHAAISPAILYWGTPVVLITSKNVDDSSNTTQNIFRTKQCVLILPSASISHFVNTIARTTGAEHMSPVKAVLGYRHVKYKWPISGMTPLGSMLVAPLRVKELSDSPTPIKGATMTLELKILRVYVDNSIRKDERIDCIGPDKWDPIIVSFQEFYGLDNSRIAKILTGSEVRDNSLDEEPSI
ncbi:hypothetical protein K469DRAFT_735874 [Zopfia rhizophila CBS 207.26]|uniref:Flavin reductase like domain-containing protein n=1 Tax=Zopfia rhizophila CBS 207.26 TaxID=1314779 RepID=A0A6A6EJ48_9PEZI|nr:hypothetical protein K469DRAFT_735874 [Zopfia rhizophila CBS 207.26]